MAQGIPKRYVACPCGSPHGYPKSGRCATCWARKIHRKYSEFTPEMDERLRTAYASTSKRPELVAQVDALVAEWKLPRFVIYRRAGVLNLRSCRRMWTDADLAYLRGNVGFTSLEAMSRHLKRTRDAVIARLDHEGMSRKAWLGYNLQDVTRLFHVASVTVRKWQAKGYLRPDADGAFSQAALERFLRGHLDLIDIRRVDQAWLRETLKGMLVVQDPDSDAGHAGYSGEMATEAVERRRQRELLAA